MNDIPDMIYKEYRKANLANMIAGNNNYVEVLIRYGLLVIFLITIYNYFTIFNESKITAIACLLLFFVLLGSLYFVAAKQVKKRQNINILSHEKSLHYMAYFNLKRVLIKERLFNTEGIRYLIEIYSSRLKRNEITIGAVILIIISAALNIFVSILLFGTEEQFFILNQRWVFLTEYLDAVIVFVIVITICLAILILLYRNVRELYYILFGLKFRQLVYTLEFNLLPAVIATNNSYDNQVERRNKQRKHRTRLNKKRTYF